MDRTLILATHNQGKVVELRQILEGLGLRLLSADDVDLPEVDETGHTFAANAELKAWSATKATGLPCVADDSGLVVDALGGEPGIYSARYAGRYGGPDRDDDANVRLVLQRLGDTPADKRSARFVCAAVLATPGGGTVLVEGSLEGRIIDEPRGSGGFGYDPIFLPAGEKLTTAEMSADAKSAISHRGKAFRALRTPIAEAFGLTPGVPP